MQTRRGLFGWLLTLLSTLFAKKAALSKEATQINPTQVLHYDNGIRMLQWISWWLPKTPFGRLCSITCSLPLPEARVGQLTLWFDYSKENGGTGQPPNLSSAGFTLTHNQSGEHGNLLVVEYYYDRGADFAHNAIRATISILSLLQYDFNYRLNNSHCSFSREHGKRWIDLYSVNDCNSGATDPMISEYLARCVEEEIQRISVPG
jgi:hypothetical protein